MNKGNQFLKGTLILTVGGMVVKAIGSLNWIFLSRVLGGEGIGLYQLAFPIYLLALSVSSAGIPVAISIITAEKVAKYDYYGAKRVFKLSLTGLTITGLIFSLLLFFGAKWLIAHQFIRDSRAYYALVALSPAIFFVTILSSFRGYLQGWQIMTPTAVSQIVEQLFRVAAMLVFASLFLPMGLEFAAGGASLGAGFGAIAGLSVLVFYYFRYDEKWKRQALRHNNVMKEPRRSVIRRIATLALPVSLSSIMLPVVANLDLFIVPARLEQAGYTVEQATELFGYLTGMAVPLVNLFTILTAALATSLVPAVAEAYSLGNRASTYQRIAGAIRLTNLVTVPGVVILGLLAEPIASMIYHAPEAGAPIGILSIGVFLLGIHQVTTGVLQGIGRTGIPVANMLAAALVKVMLNWMLTALPSLGIKGAAWATVADIGVAAALNIYFVAKYTGFALDVSSLMKSTIAAAGMGGTIYAAYRIVFEVANSNNYATAAAMLSGALVYALLIVLLGGVKAHDLEKVPVIGERLAKLITSIGLK